jgi:hypothetical protein
LEGGPPSFGPRFTGADLLRNAIERSCSFVYGTIALCGARFHVLRLPHDFVTLAGGDSRRTRALQPLVRNAYPLARTKFGLFPFRSPLLGESLLISFPRGTEMFQFPRLPPHGYVFTMRYRRITSGGFPHSEIHGSLPVQRLPVAYRSRPRPSSTPGAKASTMCPSYLDGDQALTRPEGRAAPGDTRISLAKLCSFQGPREGAPRIGARSLKTQQHEAHEQSSSAPRSGRHFGSRFSSGGTVCAAGVHDRSNPGASLERR